jgi:hypothetical protein
MQPMRWEWRSATQRMAAFGAGPAPEEPNDGPRVCPDGRVAAALVST